VSKHRLPAKQECDPAKVADLVSRAASYGVRIEGATVDMWGVRQRKREMVDGMIAIHQQKFAIPHLEQEPCRPPLRHSDDEAIGPVVQRCTCTADRTLSGASQTP
jgi:hypothetical protein